MDFRFSFSEILGTAFRITIKHFVPFTVISLIVYIPLFVLSVLAVASESWLLLGLNSMLNVVFSLVIAGAITYGVVQELKGRAITIADCVAVGLQRLLPVLLIVVLIFLSILGVALLTAWIPVVGPLILGVFAIVAMLMWYVAVPAAVIEQPGATGALGRSAALTKGHRWGILAIVLCVGILGFALSSLLGAGQDTTVTIDPLTGDMLMPTPSLAVQLVSTLIGMLVGLYHAVVQSLTYYRLRQEKEGVDIEELASVFE